MNIIAHGVDLIDCSRLAESIQRHGQRFLDRVFTPAELGYCLGKRRHLEHLAGRFAAKEAVLKVLGTGWRGGVAWKDIEVRNEPSGQPVVTLRGESKRIAERLGITRVLVSISHTPSQAIASAIGLANGAKMP